MSARTPASGIKPGPRPEIKRQDTECVENEMTNICDAIDLYGKATKPGEKGLATIRFGDLFKVNKQLSIFSSSSLYPSIQWKLTRVIFSLDSITLASLYNI